MKKIWLVLAVGLVCGSAQARDSRDERGADSRYERSADSRQERSVNACVNDYARGQKLSRKEMRKVEDQCSRSAARSPGRPSEQQAERRRYSPSMPDGSLQGRNLRGVPDTSGPP